MKGKNLRNTSITNSETTSVNKKRIDLNSNIDFQNTKIAFAHHTNGELRKASWLFRLMNNHRLVTYGSNWALRLLKWNVPFVETAIKKTIFAHFCGGTTLLNSMPAIEHLKKFDTKTILDYGVEAKQSEGDFNLTMNENIRALDFAGKTGNIPFVSIKITGLCRFELLERVQAGTPLTAEENQEYLFAFKRVDSICHVARDRKVSVMIDAEESWIQDAIDRIADEMMRRYNGEKVVVLNTFQMYRHDRLEFLKQSFIKAQQKGYLLGAKLVRGAYMEKERKRAEEMRYATPINPDKVATDQMYNDALLFCVSNYSKIMVCNATHNAQSSMLLAALMQEMGIKTGHPHFYFCQLYGMSDNLTFNLSAAGYNVAKYLPYGSVKEVVPYLIRRAQENSTVTGDMSREYSLLKKEMQRRGI